jgi:VanZ family protein
VERRGASRARLWSFQVWPAFLNAIAILVVGSLPMAPPGAEKFSDKTLHAIGFGIFAGLAARAGRALYPRAPQSKVLFVGFAASALFGGALELWQALLPYRSAEFLDFAADALGALIAVLLTAGLWQLARAKAPAA